MYKIVAATMCTLFGLQVLAVDSPRPQLDEESGRESNVETAARARRFADQFAPLEQSIAAAAKRPPMRPSYDAPWITEVYAYRSQDSYPDAGILVEENTGIGRNFAGYGATVFGLRGGGCFPASPENPACLRERNLSQYGHPKLLLFIAKMAALYRSKVDPDAVLPINDMSLPTGGSFDIRGDWGTRYHITHRHGVDVDVNASTTINGVAMAINTIELTKIVERKLNGKKITEPGSIHYRLPASEIDIVVGDVK